MEKRPSQLKKLQNEKQEEKPSVNYRKRRKKSGCGCGRKKGNL